MKAMFGVVDRDHERNIVFLEDIANYTGGITITNDARAVYTHWTHISGNDVRVVYKDTDGEWWEIVPLYSSTKTWMGQDVTFRPWYGAVWDRLSKVES